MSFRSVRLAAAGHAPVERVSHGPVRRCICLITLARNVLWRRGATPDAR